MYINTLSPCVCVWRNEPVRLTVMCQTRWLEVCQAVIAQKELNSRRHLPRAKIIANSTYEHGHERERYLG